MDTEHSPAGNPWGLEPLVDVGELAPYLGVPVSMVYDWRTRGLGPPAYRFGKHLKFVLSNVRIWIEQQRDAPPQPEFRTQCHRGCCNCRRYPVAR